MRIISIIENSDELKTLKVDSSEAFNIVNPIANNGLIINTFSYTSKDITQRLQERIISITPKFIYIIIVYTDIMLKSVFSDSFLWEISSSDGKLYESTKEQQVMIIHLINEFDHKEKYLSNSEHNQDD